MEEISIHGTNYDYKNKERKISINEMTSVKQKLILKGTNI
jgi:hypothetical protein